MNIEEVKDLRVKLSADITELVAQFQKQTGCSVERISVNHLITDAQRQPIRTAIDVKVELT